MSERARKSKPSSRAARQELNATDDVQAANAVVANASHAPEVPNHDSDEALAAKSTGQPAASESDDAPSRQPEVSVIVKEIPRPVHSGSASRPAALKRRTRVKICGITSVDMALAAAEAGADAIGLVFVATSPRYVLPGPAQRIARALPPLISSIGVFLNPSDPDLQNWRGQWVQMHGQEEEWQLARVAPNRRIIKGLKFDSEQVRRWERCPHVSALLIDGIDHSGNTPDYDRLAEMIHNLSTPVILAGGLNPRNVEQAIRTVRPYGVDVSGGVESSRGIKEVSLIREFCAAVRETDASLS